MSDVDDTARLIFMERGTGSRQITVRQFVNALRDAHPRTSLIDALNLWHKYVGNRDHGIPPSHDYITGGPYRA